MAASFFMARVLPAGTASLGVERVDSLRFLCCFAFFLHACSAVTMCFSTLGDAAVGTLGTCCEGAFIERVIRWLGSNGSCSGSFIPGASFIALRVCSAGRNNLFATSAFVATVFFCEALQLCHFLCPIVISHCLNRLRTFRNCSHYLVRMCYSRISDVLVAD